MADHIQSSDGEERSAEGTRAGDAPLIEILRSIPHLNAVLDRTEPQILRDVELMLGYIGLPAGTILFAEGDAAEDAYVLVSGRVGVFVGTEPGVAPIAQIAAGEIVGEMSLISDEPRSATVIALRDSDLVRVPRVAFGLLFQGSPQASILLMRYLVTRLSAASHAQLRTPDVETLALVPLFAPHSDPWFIGALIEALAEQGRPTVLIDGPASEREAELPRTGAASRSLAVYLAEDPASAWARRCIRQADRVIFVSLAEAGIVAAGRSALEDVETLHRAADLVLINPADRARPTGATAWLGTFSSDRILHVRRGNRDDVARVARLVLGRAIGLVLSGGGARGFAHIGVIKAFRDSGLPIDLVGGTSMGALIAGLAALDLSPAEIAERIHHAFVARNPVNDYTFPVVALSRGRKLNRLIRHHYGEGTIEDLWKNFFCLSSNLSTGEAMVHKTGLLWRALRASGAIPGIVPPLIDDGQVLVDGGVMNNFPTAVMASLQRGPVIGVEVTSGGSLFAGERAIEDRSTRRLLRKRREQIPSIVRILMRCGTVNGEIQSIASRAAADVLIQPELTGIDMLSFHAFHKAVDLGYHAGIEAVSRIEALLKLPKSFRA